MASSTKKNIGMAIVAVLAVAAVLTMSIPTASAQYPARGYYTEWAFGAYPKTTYYMYDSNDNYWGVCSFDFIKHKWSYSGYTKRGTGYSYFNPYTD
jgi:hypothetical protein